MEIFWRIFSQIKIRFTIWDLRKNMQIIEFRLFWTLNMLIWNWLEKSVYSEYINIHSNDKFFVNI